MAFWIIFAFFYKKWNIYNFRRFFYVSFQISRKDQNFMGMLNHIRLEDLISETAIVVQKALIQMKSNVSEKEPFILEEEVLTILNWFFS